MDIANDTEKSPVYRVDKKGNLDSSFLDATYSEMERKGRLQFYSLEDIGTYATSVYDNPSPCQTFISSMRGKVRDKYPCLRIVEGKITEGVWEYSWKYKGSVKDKSHIDW